ncbi:MAG: manganese catalase family protein, partial [Muribaculaceae bacterium]|nr:manganese catalase family protein [Muribaculaceae bacterium]
FQTSPKYSNLYFNLSTGNDARGPWNEGASTQLNEEWQYIDDPLKEVRDTDGLLDRKPQGTPRTEDEVRRKDETLAKQRSSEILAATPTTNMQWCKYPNVKR